MGKVNKHLAIHLRTTECLTQRPRPLQKLDQICFIESYANQVHVFAVKFLVCMCVRLIPKLCRCVCVCVRVGVKVLGLHVCVCVCVRARGGDGSLVHHVFAAQSVDRHINGL